MGKEIKYTRPFINFKTENKNYKWDINWIGIKREVRAVILKIINIHIPDFWIFKNEDTIKYEEFWERYSW